MLLLFEEYLCCKIKLLNKYMCYSVTPPNNLGTSKKEAYYPLGLRYSIVETCYNAFMTQPHGREEDDYGGFVF